MDIRTIEMILRISITWYGIIVETCLFRDIGIILLGLDEMGFLSETNCESLLFEIYICRVLENESL